MVKSGGQRSKFFFQVLKSKEAKDKVDCLCEEGENATKLDVILGSFARYCNTLLQSEDDGCKMKEDRRKNCFIIPKRISEAYSLFLNASINVEEINRAIQIMSKVKAPEP